MMKAKFLKMSYHTRMSELVRQKIANAYGRALKLIEFNDLSMNDTSALTELGYDVRNENGKLKIEL